MANLLSQTKWVVMCSVLLLITTQGLLYGSWWLCAWPHTCGKDKGCSLHIRQDVPKHQVLWRLEMVLTLLCLIFNFWFVIDDVCECVMFNVALWWLTIKMQHSQSLTCVYATINMRLLQGELRRDRRRSAVRARGRNHGDGGGGGVVSGNLSRYCAELRHGDGPQARPRGHSC